MQNLLKYSVTIFNEIGQFSSSKGHFVRRLFVYTLIGKHSLGTFSSLQK
jgi:hypothetical protein